MLDTRYGADEQIDRVNARIEEVAAEYTRSQLERTLALKAGDVRRARQVGKRMHMLNGELAYLASQLSQWDSAQYAWRRY
jgi:hypothetical protein